MPFRRILVPVAAAASALCTACSSNVGGPEEPASRAASITSVEAQIVDFSFTGEVIAGADVRDAVSRQLLYMFGVLRTSSDASGQIGNVRLTDIQETPRGATKHARYTARLPVAWPKDSAAPQSYELALPRDTTALGAFDRKYDGRCGKSEHGRDNFWHDFAPNAEGCSLDDDDVVRALATVSSHTEPTTTTYPEYERIWDDDRLDVTAIFTIIDSPRRPNDWAYVEAERFTRTAAEELAGLRVERNTPSRSLLVDTTIRGHAVVGGRLRDVQIDVLVIETVTDAGADFDERYDALSERADLVLYNGHARLGANTNVLGRKGKVVAGKYQLFLLNACDTFALVDGTMTERRREANGSRDPSGTRFLDVISNARPGRADNLANVSMEVYKAAIGADAPVSYARLIGSMPAEHVVVVYGEEDNAFFPKRSLSTVYEPQALSYR